MKNPVNRLATAAPRALDSLLQQQKKDANKKNTNNNSKKERTCSFDLDLSGLNLLDNDGSSSVGGSSVGFSGGSIAEEGGSVVTFQELSEFISLMMMVEEEDCRWIIGRVVVVRLWMLVVLMVCYRQMVVVERHLLLTKR